MNHKLCAHSQCPTCYTVPAILREAILEIQDKLIEIQYANKPNVTLVKFSTNPPPDDQL